jgi:RNA polymerase sigma-70 factor, ECF subfamily
MSQLGISIQQRRVNGRPGAILLDPDGRLVDVFSLDIVDGAIRTVRSGDQPRQAAPPRSPRRRARALLRRRRRNAEAASKE